MRLPSDRGVRLSREWILLLDEPRPGWLNMAIDAMLLDRAEATGARYLRLYRWDPWCLSFGRHEPATRRYDRSHIEAREIDVVRRPTGGRAVWHARELTYSVVSPVAEYGGLREAYAAIHGMFAEALRRLGIPADLAAPGVTPGPGAGPCFAAPVGGEVLVETRKVIGSAQVRQGSAFLQHGSLLLEDDQPFLEELSRGNGVPGSSPEAPPPLGRVLSYEEAAEAVRSIASVARTMSPGDLARLGAEADARHGERFRSPQWTWGR